MIGHRRRDRRAIAGRGAAPQLVHRHERVRRRAPQHRRRLGQLGHERGLARDDVILGAHANENRIRGGHRERSRRDVRSDVRHDRGEAHLPNQRRFTPHVGPGQEQERRVAAAAELGIVGHERFPGCERGGARVPESNGVERRPTPVSLRRHHRGGARLRERTRDLVRVLRERRQRVERGGSLRGAAPPRPIVAKLGHQRAKDVLQREFPRLARRLALRPERLELGTVELLEPFAFTLPGPVRGNLTRELVAHLAQVRVLVRAHEVHVPLGPAELFARPDEPLPQRLVRRAHPVVGGVHGLVRAGLGLDPPGLASLVPVERAFKKRESFRQFRSRRPRARPPRGVVGPCPRVGVARIALGDDGEQRRGRQPRAHAVKGADGAEDPADALQRSEKPVKPRPRRVLVEHDVRGVPAPAAGLPHEPGRGAFQVRRRAKRAARLGDGVLFRSHLPHRRLPRGDGGGGSQRAADPPPEEPAAHRAGASVQRVEQRSGAAAVAPLQHLEADERGGVEGHEASSGRFDTSRARAGNRLHATQRDQIPVDHGVREVRGHHAEGADRCGAFAPHGRSPERRERLGKRAVLKVSLRARQPLDDGVRVEQTRGRRAQRSNRGVRRRVPERGHHPRANAPGRAHDLHRLERGERAAKAAGEGVLAPRAEEEPAGGAVGGAHAHPGSAGFVVGLVGAVGFRCAVFRGFVPTRFVLHLEDGDAIRRVGRRVRHAGVHQRAPRQHRNLLPRDDVVLDRLVPRLALGELRGGLRLLHHHDPVSRAGQALGVGGVILLRESAVRLLALHVLQAEVGGADVRVHLEELVELAHLEHDDAVEVRSLEPPPLRLAGGHRERLARRVFALREGAGELQGGWVVLGIGRSAPGRVPSLIGLQPREHEPLSRLVVRRVELGRTGGRQNRFRQGGSQRLPARRRRRILRLLGRRLLRLRGRRLLRRLRGFRLGPAALSFRPGTLLLLALLLRSVVVVVILRFLGFNLKLALALVATLGRVLVSARVEVVVAIAEDDLSLGARRATRGSTAAAFNAGLLRADPPQRLSRRRPSRGDASPLRPRGRLIGL
mmetsp:Transcript_1254/g.5429  ORF Transcript_1254/g.5429 Transcript_1254/m.5429 type:complete len:1064 (-) Transcript_1254:239-3430(-)